jgi:hypothetical protein
MGRFVMDWQIFINGTLAFMIGLFGWLARELWGAVKSLQEEVKNIQIHMPTNYVRRDEFADHMQRIESKLDRIMERLESKADR